MTSLIQRLRSRLSEGLASSVTESMGTLTLGFHSPSGREMPIHIRESSGGALLLSDGGETWSDLVSEGFSAALPSESDLQRLRALAKLYGAQWSDKDRAFAILCSEGDALDAARRVTMASIALDGWRVWVPSPPKAQPSIATIMRQTATAAKHAGLTAERYPNLPSTLQHHWRCPLLLRRNNERAAIRVDEAKADHVAEHAMMFVRDTGVPAVVVTGERTAAKLVGSLELRGEHVAIVAKQQRGTGKKIVEAAEKIAA